ncbi:MAG: tRNA (adenosine(37)-N6)-dimethylallyltransferase MiaA [Bdellovibrionales bacterium]|nr:tRNA (adenosine(37)-N6)-dimethylallyltransferase MiaA [Bdellovibrionales bacterium]
MVPAQSLKTIILTGPTAVGKSSLAIEIAEKLAPRVRVEIINADSVCFYREFNIGSAKPTPQELERVPHHLIDVADPTDHYHAGKFLKDCENKMAEIRARGAVPLIVGGSGFYLKSLRHGLWKAPPTSPELRAQMEAIETDKLFEKLIARDADHAKKIGPNDRYRVIRALEIIELSGNLPSELESQMDKEPDPRFLLWVLERDKAELQTRIRERVQMMIAQGWIDETIRLRDLYPTSKTLHAVGYQQVLDFLNGVEPEGRKTEPGIPGLIDEIDLAHRQLAKTQRTWLKGLKPDRTFVLPGDSSQVFDEFSTISSGA